LAEEARVICLYHCADARSFRPLWALEELGLNYELTVMPFPPRYRAKQFMAVNPLGTIPALVDGETLMTESAAIVQYLATRYGPSPLAVEVGDSAYGAWLNWLHFGEATLTFPQTLVLRYRRLEPGKAEVVADDYAKWFLARLRAVDRALRDAEHLCAGRFTGADISVGYALLLAEIVGLDAEFTPAIAAYWGRLQARTGFNAAKAAQLKHAAAVGEALGRMSSETNTFPWTI
jgi:glutathione S-transferase